MDRKLLLTEDGSHTIVVESPPFSSLPVTYHSMHGAVQESLHVYIEAGLRQVEAEGVAQVFEMGFGTGLNALLTLLEARKAVKHIYYQAVELYPLSHGEASPLNFPARLASGKDLADIQALFDHLHTCPWEEDVPLDPLFTLHKTLGSIADIPLPPRLDLIYYDAFAPMAQPELWTFDIFEKLLASLRPGGMLVTYCSKGAVRRALQEAGFRVEKLPGPAGKREMLRAVRPPGLTGG